MWLVLSVAAIAVGVIVLGTLVLVRSARSMMHISFAMFAYATGLWTVANFIDTNYKTLSIAPLATYVDFILGCFLGYVIWAFASSLLAQADRAQKYHWLYGRFMQIAVGITTTLAALLVFVPGVLLIEQLPGKPLHITYGPGYAMYSGLLLLLAPLIIVTTFFARRQAQGRLRQQISIILAALVVTVLMLASADLVLPNLSTTPVINLISGDLSYLGFACIVAGTFYSIVRRRLFDIRLAIARTLGFVAVIGILAVAYSLLVLGIGAPLLTNGRVTPLSNPTQLLIFLPPTIVVALTAHSLQRLVARITRRVFLQDSYDTRLVLDRFSEALMSDNDMDVIVEGGLAVLTDAIKPAHTLLIVLDEHSGVYRHYAIGHAAPQNIQALIAVAKHTKQPLTIKDELQADDWPQVLEQADVALVLQLGTARKRVGFLCFGPKQSGRMYTKQDIGLLSVSAKYFGIAIENAKKYDQISAFTETLKAEVDKATANLRRANTKLKTLDAMKDDFLSMASHQLRSPATSVRDAIQMLEQTYVTPAERTRILELADISSERLVNVVTDMLSVARIQAGHFTIEKTNVDMVELVGRTVEQARTLARSKNITITTHYPKQPVKIKADRAKIIEILSNYLENAIRYSDEQSEIVVTVLQDGKRVSFEVRDHGIGVPEGERKHLFDRFFRASNARKNQPNGNGIGLFVVKTVAKAHGGDAYYQALPDGSLFGFWLKS